MQAVRQGATIALVLPVWNSLSAWPLLTEDGRHFGRLVRDHILFWPYLYKGPDVTSNMFSGFTPYPFMALLIDGKVQSPFESESTRASCRYNGCTRCQ